MNWQALVDEINNDPLSRGYSGMTAAEIVESLMTVNRQQMSTTLTAAQIYESIDRTEWASLDAGDKEEIRVILGLGGDIQIDVGCKAREVLLGAFGGGSTSISNMQSQRASYISRASELGLGRVRVGWVKEIIGEEMSV